MTYRSRIGIFVLFSISFLLSISPSAFSLEVSSSSFDMVVISVGVLNGAETPASANTISYLATVGDTLSVEGTEGLTLSELYQAQVSRLYLLEYEVEEKEELIFDLRAKEDILGASILEKTWTQDNDPYFYWDTIVDAQEKIGGYSVSLDSAPDLISEVTEPSYQFADDSISSGKHIFYVMPCTSEKVWKDDNQLSFEIWVDTDIPVIDQLTPAAGLFISQETAYISCALSDRDSGLNLETLILSLNNQPISFSYDAEKKILSSKEKVALSQGENTVSLKVCDNVDNCLTKAWTFIADTLPPLGSITINGGEEITYSAYVNINVDVKDETSGIKYIYLSNDGIFDTELTTPYSYKPLITGWLLKDPDTDADKEVFAMFEDYVGNRSSICKAGITLKLRTPDTRIISGPPAATEVTEAVFSYEASKEGCLFSYKLDEQDWSDWTDKKEMSFSGLPEDNHYFYVKAGYDINGDGEITVDEEDPTPAVWVWTVGTGENLERLRKILFWRR